ncbi:hypothetical protein M8C21_005066 [Ambrosia artemisiifolia]|uniref:Terpene synthase metal-binding domain-containing protein n=1 Tax=Ambrosia artemisiifolia TaxID=4212 RepID=A0AAD5CR24_AMBAR|nr:hypothetical protein M8C21_005066 [Ambrosia artemisiifolia]
MDDIVTHKAESDRNHVASGITCYMNEFGISEEQTYEVFDERVKSAWTELNGEFIACKDATLPIKMRVIDFARSMEVLYKNKDHFTNVGDELKNHIKSLLVDAIIT